MWFADIYLRLPCGGIIDNQRHHITLCGYCGRHTFGPCRCSRIVPTPEVLYHPPVYAPVAQDPPPYNHWTPLHCEKNPSPEWFANWEATIPCGTCRDNYAKLRIEPRYDDWFAFAWELHNLVNAHIGKPIITLDEAYRIQLNLVQLREPPITEKAKSHKPTSKRLVIVVAVDAQTQSELEISRDAFVAYAKKCGADYVEITDAQTDCGHVTANKYAILPYVEKYEQTLYLDCDIIIQNDPPSIFDLVPVDAWGLVDDLAKVREGSEIAGTGMQTEIETICGQIGLPKYEITKAWNSGMMVMPRHGKRSYFAPAKRIQNVWCCEQEFHGIMLHFNRETIVELSDQWNLGYPWTDWLPKLPTAYFVHVNGCKPHSLRLDLMRAIKAGDSLTELLKDTQHKNILDTRTPVA